MSERSPPTKKTDPVIPVQRVTLDLKTATALLLVVVSGVISTVAGVHKMSSDLKTEMLRMESRWVERVAEVETRIRTEMSELERSLPPPQVTERFKFLEHRLDSIESRIGMPNGGN